MKDSSAFPCGETHCTCPLPAGSLDRPAGFCYNLSAVWDTAFLGTMRYLFYALCPELSSAETYARTANHAGPLIRSVFSQVDPRICSFFQEFSKIIFSFPKNFCISAALPVRCRRSVPCGKPPRRFIFSPGLLSIPRPVPAATRSVLLSTPPITGGSRRFPCGGNILVCG